MAIYTSDHIGKWYWLKYDNKIVLAEEFTTELSRSVSNKKLIQGDAGVHVMSVNGKTMTSTISSDVLIEIPQPKSLINGPVPSVVIPPYNPGYKDVLDLLIDDFALIRANLYNPDYWYMRPKNLLTSASLQIGSTIRCSLNYNAYYDQIFELIQFADVFPSNYDFLARVAKNYDCRFNVTANDAALSYKILSGSINITVSHTKSFLINLESEYPIFSPQGYQISGSFKIPANNWDELLSVFENNDVTLSNFSLLVGSRYLRLGQASVQSSIKFNNESFRTAEINFVGYARI